MALINVWKIKKRINLEVGFIIEAIVKNYNFKKLLIKKVELNLYYIVKYLTKTNVYNLEIYIPHLRINVLNKNL